MEKSNNELQAHPSVPVLNNSTSPVYDEAYDIEKRDEKDLNLVEIRSDNASDDLPFDMYSGDPFPPLPDAVFEPNPLTFRAVFIGCCLGAIVAASK